MATARKTFMQRAGFVLRIVFAVLGIALIVGVLAYNWHGRVVFPPGFAGNTEEASVRVVAIENEVEPRRYRLAEPNAVGLAAVSGDELSDSAATPTRVPGTPELFRSVDWRFMLGGLLLMGPVFPAQALRWWWLMRCRDMRVSFGKALRLTMVGQFFNICMPGATGGDVIRAYYGAKGSGRRTDAVVSVGFDRATGLVGLVLLVGLVGLTILDHPVARPITIAVWAGIAALMVCFGVYSSKRIRRALRLGLIVDRLPGNTLLRKVDTSITAYRQHVLSLVGCAAFSVPIHFSLALAATMCGYALGVDRPLLELMTLIPVVFLMGAIPISPSGLGLMEGAAVLLIDAGVNQVVGMILLYRLLLLFYGLIGAGVMLASDIHLHPQEHEPEARVLDEAGQPA